MPEVLSVVTVVLDRREGLARTARSLLDQHGVPDGSWEWVVVDGGSTDGTLEALADLADRLPVRLTSEPDRGIYDAMNKGWRGAQGEWCQFLNAGDVLAGPATLQRTVARLAQARAPWVVARTRFVDDRGRTIRISRTVPFHRWAHLLAVRMHAHPSTLMRRSLIERLGGFSEAYGAIGDFDLVVRAARVAAPEGWDEVLVDFEPPGASEEHLRELPALFSRVRLGALPRGWRWAEAVWAPAFRLNWLRRLPR